MYGYVIICRRCGYRKKIIMRSPFTLKDTYCPNCKKECENVALPELKEKL